MHGISTQKEDVADELQKYNITKKKGIGKSTFGYYIMLYSGVFVAEDKRVIVHAKTWEIISEILLKMDMNSLCSYIRLKQ